jgi:rare lipoprotein A
MTLRWCPDVRTILVLILLSLTASCATQPELPQGSLPGQAAPIVAPPSLPTATRTGVKASRGVRASYQGNAQAGHLTASGERYDPNELTAASRTLPIGSSVVVTNPTTGRSVKVRINDRGPYAGSRGLDLSKRAAETIGMTNRGVTRVQVKRTASKPQTHESPGSSRDSSLISNPNSDR